MFSIRTISFATVLAVLLMGSAQARPPIVGGGQKPQNGTRERLPWSAARGRPQINFGRAVGRYIWHEGNRVHLVSSDDKAKGQVIHGMITLRGPNGAIFDVDKVQDESQDHVGKNGDRIHFKLDTHTASDGFKFSIRGGRFLAVEVNQNGPRGMDRNVYVGGNQMQANKGIIVFDLGK